ncbi:MAG TPA: BON domain-containing protein [Bryobacteraceae bacterium]|nr:BON domain-containing protein [Bryobacteraceae bacterium]
MIKDTHIRDDVQRELFYTPGLNAASIGVAVDDGVVTLTGTIGSYPQKLAALHAAERIAHVKAVACKIEVRLPGPQVRNDADLAHAAANVLDWNSSVPPDRIRIRVENGWITLEGTVDWQYQKNAAATAIVGLTGVKGVANLVSVSPGMSAENIREQIEAALKRSATIEDRNILVEVREDKVVLHGEVHSIPDREEAERIAWSAPGVSDVANHILIAELVPVNV